MNVLQSSERSPKTNFFLAILLQIAVIFVSPLSVTGESIPTESSSVVSLKQAVEPSARASIDNNPGQEEPLRKLESLLNEIEARLKRNDEVIKLSENLLKKAKTDGNAATIKSAMNAIKYAEDAKDKNLHAKAGAEEALAWIRQFKTKKNSAVAISKEATNILEKLGVAFVPFTPQVSFANALAKYSMEKYTTNGYVNLKGVVTNGGLGCSSFVNVVLDQLRFGTNYFHNTDRIQTYQLYQKKGADMARAYNLTPACGGDEIQAAKLSSSVGTKELLDSNHLKVGKLYLFDAENDNPKEGHTGFIRIKSNGDIDQWHYSSTVDGLATGDFHAWVRKNRYRNGRFTLFEVPENQLE